MIASDAERAVTRAGAKTPTGRRNKFWWRVLLAGPLVAATSITVLCGSSLWLPKGAAQINHLVLPMVLFPAIWAALFFHACLDHRLVRAYAINGVLLLLNASLVVIHLGLSP